MITNLLMEFQEISRIALMEDLEITRLSTKMHPHLTTRTTWMPKQSTSLRKRNTRRTSRMDIV